MEKNWETRYTLLQRASDPNDGNAWDEFVTYYQPFIRMVLAKWKLPPHDTHDLTQDVLLKIWSNLSRYDSKRAKFRTWLSRIIKNRVLDYFKAHKHTLISSEQIQQALEAEANNNANTNLEESIQEEWTHYITQLALQNVKKLFSGLAIEVFELSLEGHSSKEIGNRLDIATNSVRTLRNRVKLRVVDEIQALRQEIELQ